MARESTAWVQRGAEATWHSHGWPARGARGAQGGAATWQEATQSRDPRGHLCGAPGGRLVSGGPTGIVGPG